MKKRNKKIKKQGRVKKGRNVFQPAKWKEAGKDGWNVSDGRSGDYDLGLPFPSLFLKSFVQTKFKQGQIEKARMILRRAKSHRLVWFQGGNRFMVLSGEGHILIHFLISPSSHTFSLSLPGISLKFAIIKGNSRPSFWFWSILWTIGMWFFLKS